MIKPEKSKNKKNSVEILLQSSTQNIPIEKRVLTEQKIIKPSETIWGNESTWGRVRS